MNYKESINWLYSFKSHGSKLELERISHLLSRLGNPQNNYKTIHVTGTNGKGSVCNYIFSVLNKAGFKTGIYISPHLQRFSERIVVNDNEISNKDVANLILQIKPFVEDMQKENNSPTFFEIVTTMAFQHFHNQNVDFAVIEVGLDGRFDATNVINPMVSVITNISLEHTKNLGENVESIAFEKAGIIKEKTQIITAAKNPSLAVIKKVAKEKKSTIKTIDDSYWKRTFQSDDYQEFQINGLIKEYKVKTSLLGLYQGENIALAIITLEILQMRGVYLTDANIKEGIYQSFNPGRMEIYSKYPTIILDGAHNPAGAEMLRKTIENDFHYKKLITVVGILEDKDINSMLKHIVSFSDIIIITKSKNMRACDPNLIKEKIKDLGFSKNIIIKDTILSALDYARSVATKEDVICITGSLYTVGEARNYLSNT
jgi:dihydrofolate synthase/folylpolyglutamate synthase